MVVHHRTRIGMLGLVSCVISLMLLAGCGGKSVNGLSRNTTPATSVSAPTATTMAMNTATPAVQAVENPCAEPTPAPPAPATTPPIIAPSGWATYVSSDYHYSIQYPANWPYEPATPPTSMVFQVRNYVQSQYSGAGDETPPPLHSIEVDAYPNSSGLSAREFYVTNNQVNPVGPPACSQTTFAVTIAGRAALEMVQHPVHWQNGVIDFIGVTYYVPNGANILILDENYSPNGQPSDIFAHMIASLAVSG